ncbi:MAG: hypothetical protein KDD33_01275 [Bdellovibrionales bacterium]|nr:hypothetical protein [Bdellovibrionales bacterium]
MLKLGDQVSAKLIEKVDTHHWIVSFEGDLLQVRNATTFTFEAGKIVSLQVVSERPLQFKIIGLASNKSFRGLNVRV